MRILQSKAAKRDERRPNFRRLRQVLAAEAVKVKALFRDSYANERTNQSNEAIFHDREV